MKASSIILVLAVFASISFAAGGNYGAYPVTYSALTGDTYRVATAPGDTPCAAYSGGDWQYAGAKLIEVKSCEAIFGGAGDVLPGEYYFEEIYLDPIGLTNNGSTSLNGTYFQSPNPNQWSARVFYRIPGRDCFNWEHLEYGAFNLQNFVGIPSLGGEGSIFLDKSLATGYGYDAAVVIHENAPSVRASFVMFNSSTSYQTMRFAPNVGYFEPSYSGAIYEPPFTTERGTRYLSVGTTDVSLQAAKEVAKPSFLFTSSPAAWGTTTSVSNHRFETLITDTIDRTLQNRQYNLSEDQYPALLSSPDTGGQIASPLRGTGEQGTAKAKLLYRIGSGQYKPFADKAVSDPQSGLGQYTEKQSFWAGSLPNAVAYDSASNVRDVDVNRYSAIAYSAKFEGNDYGIPFCTSDLSIPGDYASCANNTSGQTARHRVKITFMNSEWIISTMVAPHPQLPSSTAAINGGIVKLAKESKYGILSLNQSLDAGDGYFVVLADVVFCSYSGDICPKVSVVKNGAAIAQLVISQGTTYLYNPPGTNKLIRIHPYKAGLTPAKWAEMALYSDEITLIDGARYNLVSANHTDKDFYVSLLWKNRDYGNTSTSTQPDSLREIVVYNINGFTAKTLKGESQTMLKSKPAFSLKFEGITAVPSCTANNTTPPGNNTNCTQVNLGSTMVVAGTSYSLRLDDLSVGESNAIFSILDANGVVVLQGQVAEGAAQVFSIGSQNVAVNVCETYFTSTLSEVWAKINAHATSAPADDPCPPVPGSATVSIGQQFTGGASSYAVKLSDISVGTGLPLSYPAILEVIDPNGATISVLQAGSGSTYVQQLPNSQKIAIHVCQTAPGFTLNAKWAKITITSTNQPPTNGCLGFSAVNIGGELDSGNYKTRLADISTPIGATSAHSAILDILDSNNALVGQAQAMPGSNVSVALTPNQSITVSICETAPGYTLNAKWAKINSFISSLPPTNTCPGMPVVNVGQSIDLGAYQLKLYDISTMGANPATIQVLDPNGAILTQVLLDPGSSYTYAQNGSNSSVLMNVCETASGYTLSARWAKMAGALSAQNNTSSIIISYNALAPDTYRVATAPGDVPCGAVPSFDWMYQGAKMYNLGATSQIFGGTGDLLSGDYTFDNVLVDLVGNTIGNGASSLNGAFNSSAFPDQWVPRVFYKVFGRDCYNWEYITAPAGGMVTYENLAPDTYRVATAQGDVPCGAVSAFDWSYHNPKLVRLGSPSQIFGGTGDQLSGDYTFDQVLLDIVGNTGNGMSLNGSFYNPFNTSLWMPRVFYKVPGRDCYNWNMIGGTVIEVAYVSKNNTTANNTSIAIKPPVASPCPEPIADINCNSFTAVREYKDKKGCKHICKPVSEEAPTTASSKQTPSASDTAPASGGTSATITKPVAAVELPTVEVPLPPAVSETPSTEVTLPAASETATTTTSSTGASTKVTVSVNTTTTKPISPASSSGESAETISKLTNSMVGLENDVYATIMNVLGVYIQGAD